ncbi:S9 family peptidase [Flammeovirga sp. SJP92]|uniref:alpha/beta hydrolase family protein n=1 Tax=Flammeovirga sp. SJP92 TaxID=1775430 RepID=UPI00156128BC|nr:prolyl oligopeptidase family serine peptidase [Flammeovirga sp. SJP92]
MQNIKSLAITFILIANFISLCTIESSAQVQKSRYKDFRKNFKTSIIKEIKAPQFYNEFDSPPENVSVVSYESNGRKLKGLLNTVNLDSTKKTKAIVYLHGGFSLGYSDLSDCQPFIDAGYIVFAPTYRGENGNEGNFEYFFGEVEDAENAVNWLAKQSYIDSEQIFVFGHSIGGGMSALLSLNNNCASKLNGSSSGIYFQEWLPQLVDEENMPFDISIENEILYRCPVYTLNYLERRHLMYIGSDDDFEWYKTTIEEMYENTIPKYFNLIELDGDHFSSLEPSMIKFIEEIEKKL